MSRKTYDQGFDDYGLGRTGSRLYYGWERDARDYQDGWRAAEARREIQAADDRAREARRARDWRIAEQMAEEAENDQTQF